LLGEHEYALHLRCAFVDDAGRVFSVVKSPGPVASMLCSDGWLAGFVILNSTGGWVGFRAWGCWILLFMLKLVANSGSV